MPARDRVHLELAENDLLALSEALSRLLREEHDEPLMRVLHEITRALGDRMETVRSPRDP